MRDSLRYVLVISYRVYMKWRFSSSHVHRRYNNEVTHALPVQVYQKSDFIPKRALVRCLLDTVTSFRSGIKNSLRYSNRGRGEGETGTGITRSDMNQLNEHRPKEVIGVNSYQYESHTGTM